MKRDLYSIVLAYIILTIGSFLFIFPFLWMISTSLKSDAQLFVFPPPLIPNPIQWSNYKRMINYLPFFLFIKNTVYVTILNIVGSLFSCSLVAFGFARLKFIGRDFLFILLLSTMMLPPQVTMVPIYLIFKQLRWIDTFKPLWIRSFFGTPFYIFLLRQFFMTIPYELDDAAKIDGCTYFQLYLKILLPLIKPALVTIGIYSFMGAWNDFLSPLIFINSTQNMTISLGLRLFQQTQSGEWALMMAAATVTVIPAVIIFFLAQRYFISGITLTGLKE